MKRGIEVENTYDRSGNYVMIIRKARGKLTLDEIREAAMEYDQDYYGLVMKCMDEDMDQYYDDDLLGDAAELYRMSDVLEMMERVKMR